MNGILNATSHIATNFQHYCKHSVIFTFNFTSYLTCFSYAIPTSIDIFTKA